MTLEKLSHDKELIQGLHSGDFCLVLGAGFSAGIKNMTTPEDLSELEIPYEKYQNIPSGNFVSLTNDIFGEGVQNYTSAANNWINQDFKKLTKSGKEIDLKSFFVSLMTADEDWLKNNLLGLYKYILTPAWYNIYTFNFDNVLENLIKLTAKHNSYYFVYPPKTGLDKTSRTAVVHLHGYIKGSQPEELTFNSLAYMIARKSNNSLYNPFYSDVSSGKKLFILGTKFDEDIIDDKFFDDLKEKPISIYHFARDNNDFRQKPWINRNPNYHFIKINDTIEVLKFIAQNRTKIENINIPGADVITDDFIKAIVKNGNDRKIEPSDFYLAKTDEICQWYGILNDWDIERDTYTFIRDQVSMSFRDKYRLAKICSVVTGRGGSGKSILLRRLAIDLANEEFTVLWINDKKITEFNDHGIQKLTSEYSEKNFLVVIEDLYRIKPGSDLIKEIMTKLSAMDNIRVIVGDRKAETSIYGEHIYSPDKNIIQLSVKENKQIVSEILEKVPAWKEYSDLLLQTEDDYNSPLYLILWTIGRTAEKQETEPSGNTLKSDDLVGHFRSLIESDLKAIAKYYPGLAQMIYYWASVYSTNKTYISMNLFLQLSDYFNKTNNHCILAFESSIIKPIIDSYLHEAIGFIKSAGDLNLIAFNHDILTEEGLSKVKLEDWHEFDDSIKMQILPIVIETADDFSASGFFSYCMRTTNNRALPGDKILQYTYQLLSKGNYGTYMASVLKNKNITHEVKNNFAVNILQNKVFWKLPLATVRTAINVLDKAEKNFIAAKVLSQNEFWKLPIKIVSIALNVISDRGIKEEAINKIFAQESFWNLPIDIVSTALNVAPKQVMKDSASQKILSQKGFWRLPKEIVRTAISIASQQTERNKAAAAILSQDNFWNLPQEIVNIAFKVTSDEKLIADASSKVLKQPEFWKLNDSIICTSLNAAHNQKLKEDAIIRILSQDKFWELSFAIVSTAINITSNKELKEEAVNKLLKLDNFLKLPKEIISTALNISSDRLLKNNAAKKILLQDEFWLQPHDIVSTAMKITSIQELKDDTAKIILNQYEFWTLPYDIVSTAMNVISDQTAKDKAANQILTQNEFWELKYHIVSTAMNIISDQTLKNKAARQILTQNEFWELPYQIVSTAMNIISDQTIKDKAASQILEQNEFWKLPYQTVSTAMNVISDQTAKDKAANLILTQNEFWKLSNPIVNTAFNVSNQDIKDIASRHILSQKEFWKLPNQIVNVAMNVISDKEIKDKTSAIIMNLKNIRTIPKDILSTAMLVSSDKRLKEITAKIILNSPLGEFHKYLVIPSLFVLAQAPKLPQIAVEAAKKIITAYKKDSCPDNYFLYVHLLRIPLHSIPEWNNLSLRNINNWQSLNRIFISNTILAFQSKPDSIKHVCTQILNSWRLEMKKKVRLFSDAPREGEHIKLSLGHPMLSKLAKSTAKEILDYNVMVLNDVPKHLVETAMQILNNKYPEWDLNKL